MSQFSFNKGERLSSSETISNLFRNGRSAVQFPLRFIYTVDMESNFPARMAVSVPKRLFKRAVDRNLLKRRIREAYRLQKNDFYKELEKKHVRLNLVIQYQHGEIMDYEKLEKSVRAGLDKVVRQNSAPTPTVN
jgi:ribonuclease P protein component